MSNFPEPVSESTLAARWPEPNSAVQRALGEFTNIEMAMDDCLAFISARFAKANATLTKKDMAEMRYALAELSHDVLKDATDTLEAHDEEVPDLHKAGA